MALPERRAGKKAKKHAAKSVEAAGRTTQRAEKADDELQKLAAQVGPVVSEGAREARSKASGFYDQYAPEVQQKLRDQGDRLSELSQNLGPRADKFVHDVQADYLTRARRTAEPQQKLRAQRDRRAELSQNLGPRADKFVHDVQDDYLPRARRTAETTGNVLKAAAGAARQEFDKGQGDIKSAALTPVPKKKGR